MCPTSLWDSMVGWASHTNTGGSYSGTEIVAWGDSAKGGPESVFPICHGLHLATGDPRVPKGSVGHTELLRGLMFWNNLGDSTSQSMGSLARSNGNANAQQLLPT